MLYKVIFKHITFILSPLFDPLHTVIVPAVYLFDQILHFGAFKCTKNTLEFTSCVLYSYKMRVTVCT